MLLSLVSPASIDATINPWNVELEDYVEAVEIIYWAVQDIDELRNDARLTALLSSVDQNKTSDVEELSKAYNQKIQQLLDQWKSSKRRRPAFLNRKISRPHAQFILSLCYSRAVRRPELLNQYQPFSPSVYGESSFELVTEMIDDVGLSGKDIFADLGSGVGQVVLQVAALTDVDYCHGIEYASYPGECAQRMGTLFAELMHFYGKPYRPFKLHRGDFLDIQYESLFNQMTFVFVNNFAFGPEVDHKLKLRFANLKIGSKVVSSKPYRPLNFRITDRNLGDIASMMTVRVLKAIPDAVSWTHVPLSYYLHVLDTTELEAYFSNVTKARRKPVNPTPAPSSSTSTATNSTKATSSTSSSSSSLSTRSHNRATIKPLEEEGRIRKTDTSLRQTTSRNRYDVVSVVYRRRDRRRYLRSQRPSRRRQVPPSQLSELNDRVVSSSRGESSSRPDKESSETPSPLSTVGRCQLAVVKNGFCREDSTIITNDDNDDTWSESAANETSVAQRRVIRQCRQSITPAPTNEVDASTTHENDIKPSATLRSVNQRHNTKRCTSVLDRVNKHRRRLTVRTAANNNRLVIGGRPRGRPPLSRTRLSRSRRKQQLVTYKHEQRDDSSRKQKSQINRLHADTVARLSKRSQPQLPPSANDASMVSACSSENPLRVGDLKRSLLTSSSDPHIGHSQQPVPLAVEQYLVMLRRRLMDQMTAMQSPLYKSHIEVQLKAERERQKRLACEVGRLQQAITASHVTGTQLLLQSMQRLGMSVGTPADFFTQARALIKRHTLLENSITEHQGLISKLSAENRELSRYVSPKPPKPKASNSVTSISKGAASLVNKPRNLPPLIPTHQDQQQSSSFPFVINHGDTTNASHPPPLLIPPPFLVRTTDAPPLLVTSTSSLSTQVPISSCSTESTDIAPPPPLLPMDFSQTVTTSAPPPTLSLPPRKRQWLEDENEGYPNRKWESAISNRRNSQSPPPLSPASGGTNGAPSSSSSCSPPSLPQPPPLVPLIVPVSSTNNLEPSPSNVTQIGLV